MPIANPLRLSCTAAVCLVAASLPVSAQQKPAAPFAWVIAENGQLPPGALAAGTENNQPTAACRILLQGALYAGRVANGACRAALAGREAAERRYEVFVAEPRAIAWLHAGEINRLPPGAIAAGYEPGPQINLLCRAPMPAGMVPGRLTARGCIVGHAGGEASQSNFQVAVLASPAIAVRAGALAAPAPAETAAQSFAQNARATLAALEAEMIGAGVRADDPLFALAQRLAAATERMTRAAAPAAAVPAPPASPAARAVTPFEQATQEAQAAAGQIEAAAAAAPRGFADMLRVLQAKLRADILNLQQALQAARGPDAK